MMDNAQIIKTASDAPSSEILRILSVIVFVTVYIIDYGKMCMPLSFP
jgi:hypothetical protein